LQKLTRGPRLFIAVPEFRAAIALNVDVDVATAIVIVSTVVIVQGFYHLQCDASAFAFFAVGLGSILGAVTLPVELSLAEERWLILVGSVVVTLGLLLGVAQYGLISLLLLWALLGFGVAWALTPVTYLIRRIADPADLQTLYAVRCRWPIAAC
jgi:hypothetical protein